MARRCCSVFVVFLLQLIMTVSQDSLKEDGLKGILGEEYEQIINSVPALFEYLLQMLDKRPEVLETDDFTIFHDMSHAVSERQSKRDTKNKCGSGDFTEGTKDIKRSVVSKYIKTDNARDLSADIAGIIKTVDNKRSIDGFEKINNIMKHVESESHSHNKMISKNSVSKLSTDKSKLKKSVKNTSKGIKEKKWDVINFGDSFLGSIDWTKFYLSPDEVEKQALDIEKAIEEHNRQNKER